LDVIYQAERVGLFEVSGIKSIFARQIAKAAGPCGNNRDYVFKLEQAMHSIGHADKGVIMLANEVRKILGGFHNVFHLSPL